MSDPPTRARDADHAMTFHRTSLAVIAVLFTLGGNPRAAAQLPTLGQAPASGSTTTTVLPVPPERASPRATMRTFSEAIARGDLGAATLEVPDRDLPADVVVMSGRDLAVALKEVLDRVRLVEPDDLPDDAAAPPLELAALAGHRIVLARTAAGDWRFDRATVAGLPAFWEAVRSRPVLDGATGAPLVPSLWLRAQMPAELRRTAFLFEHWQWLGILLLFALGVVVDRTASWILRRVLAHRLTDRLERLASDDVMRQSLRPLGLLAMAALWWAGLAWLGLPPRPLSWALVAVKLITFVSLVWLSYRLVDLFAAVFARDADPRTARLYNQLVPMVRKLIKVAIAAVGAVVLLANLGADVTGLIAGLGLGGLALALAAQDVLKNFFGSLTVLLDRPFQVGDLVRVDNVEGTVEEIGFRSTRLRTAYHSLVTLPNSNLINAAVDNLSARRSRRYRTTIGLRYDTPPERIEAFCAGVRELVSRHPHTRKDQDAHVFVHELSPSSLDVLLNVFFDAAELEAELAARHRLILDILRLAERLGVALAFPTRTLRWEQADAARAITGTADQSSP